MMSTNDRAGFLRWQDYRIQQLGFVNNLFVGLSTGIIGITGYVVFAQPVALVNFEPVLVGMALIFHALSVLAGSAVAWNRLRDFRATAQVVRKRSTENVSELRDKAEQLGDKTWCILKVQGGTFVLGLALFAVAVCVRIF
jgi:hypothetical protein